MIDKISKLIWFICDMPLPDRLACAYINFCIHTEMLYDKSTYEALLTFSKGFYSLTGQKIAVCVTTPRCALVGQTIVKNNVSEEVFRSRVRDISTFADIGYHGHFYREDGGHLVPVSGSNYNKDLIVKQIGAELEWFRAIGVRPKIYIGGWWFLSEDIILELERLGIEVDVSIRKDLTDSFGARFAQNFDIPECGTPFILPPSKGILEIRSIFGPVMPRQIMKKHLSEHLARDPQKTLYFIFPLHDWDILKYYRNIWQNVNELVKFKASIDWMSIPRMRETFLNKTCGAK